ncbi:MFS general substrate transporter [Amniculicola lignicola CBS 123094]|uniref:MFS general substrate transporter n=1 Tax=Amniculicola lignicola CBS 123094 TaxID=1392246 RepID=A0A6A5VYW0_9PLEO|nr:MFS general substrate transporter [Amniculicola lignicola CBS 123094]
MHMHPADLLPNQRSTTGGASFIASCRWVRILVVTYCTQEYVVTCGTLVADSGLKRLGPSPDNLTSQHPSAHLTTPSQKQYRAPNTAWCFSSAAAPLRSCLPFPLSIRWTTRRGAEAASPAPIPFVSAHFLFFLRDDGTPRLAYDPPAGVQVSCLGCPYLPSSFEVSPSTYGLDTVNPSISMSTMETLTEEHDEKLYRPRHISLQSHVDNIAKESIYGTHRTQSQQTLPLPTYLYREGRDSEHSGYSVRRLIDPYQYRESSDYDSQLEQNHDEEVASLPRGGAAGGGKLIAMTSMQEFLFVGVCAVSHLMTQAALGQALAPIDIIAETFGTVNPGEMSWFIAAYSLTVGTFIMISGRLGDIFGHKRVFTFGYAWLGVWSCFAGFSAYSKKQIWFDVCRAMQGIGPALLMPNALALFGRAYAPGIRKNIVFSIFGALAPAGFVIGAAFGSLFAQLAWWPWAFWSYGITAFALSAFSLLAIPKVLSERPIVRPKFDWTGSILVVAGLVLVNVSFNNAPLYGWDTPHVYFVLIMGLMCLGAFVWVEVRAVNPLLPMHALNSTVFFVLALVGVGWGSFGIWVFYTVRFMIVIRGATPLSVAAQYAPAVIAGLVAAGMTGFMLTHTPVSFVMMLSMIAFCGGIAISCFQPAHQIYWAQTFVGIVIMPFGMDMSFPAATVILSNHMPREHQGLAASLVNTVVNYSISIALGIAGTVEVYAPYGGDPFAQNRNAFYSAIGLSGLGVILGLVFFLKTFIKEGWVVMDH